MTSPAISAPAVTPSLTVTPTPAVTPSPKPEWSVGQQLYPVGLDQMGAVNAAGDFVYDMEYEYIDQLYNSDCYLISRQIQEEEPSFAIGDAQGNLLVGFEIVSCYRDANAPVIAYSDEKWQEEKAQHVLIFDVEAKKIIVDSADWPYSFDLYEVESNGQTLLLSKKIGPDFYDREYFIYSLDELRAGHREPAYSYRVGIAFVQDGSAYYMLRTFLDLPDQGRIKIEGLLNPDGSVLIPQGEYEDIFPRQGGGFLVHSQFTWIYLDKDLQEEMRIECKYADDFSGPCAKATLYDDSYALIDRTGAFVTQTYAGLEPMPPYWFAYTIPFIDNMSIIGPDGAARALDMAFLQAAAPGYTVQGASVMGDFLCIQYGLETEDTLDGELPPGVMENLYGLLNPADFTWLIAPGNYRYIYEGWRDDEYAFDESLQLIFADRPAYPNSANLVTDVYSADGALMLEGVKEVYAATKDYVSFVKGFEYVCMTWDKQVLYRQPVFISPVMD